MTNSARRLGLALGIGAAAVLAGTGAAQAKPTPPDLQATNIPYTAWAGTQLRLMTCSPILEHVDPDQVAVSVESFTNGDVDNVSVFNPSIAHIGDCLRVNVVSLKDGLARIKLKAFSDNKLHDELFEHQFLAIWMQLGTPSLTAVPTTNRLDVKEAGTFTDPAAPGGKYTLPTDWPALAKALATTSDTQVDDPSTLWDIHDTSSPTPDTHVPGFCTSGVDPKALIDQVDDCNGGTMNGPFSRVFGDSVNNVVGPFDPARPNTLLSDGQLTADDAPMPAARVDIEIAPNTPGQIDGAGSLLGVSKAVVDSRDGTGSSKPHNLYAPYYQQYVPATAAGEDSSGTDWLVQNDFGLNYFGKYTDWSTIPLRTNVPTPTTCNRTVAFPGGGSWDTPRTTPSGDRDVALFTDEHGEAQVEFKPYSGGFYYDALPAAIHNANRGCDLQGIPTIGTAAITATAKYPGQPVDYPAMPSVPVTKTVPNLFDKSLHVYTKGAGAENANARILVAHGQDVDGTAFAGERVCFYVNHDADSYRLFSGTVGTGSTAFAVNTAQVPTPSQIDPSVRCAALDRNGNAALEVFDSNGDKVNVIAEYIDEGLLRSRDVDFSTATADPTPPPSTGPAPATPSVGPSTDTPSTAQAIATMGAPAADAVLSGKPAKTEKTKLDRALIARVHKTRWLEVKVSSSDKHARIAIRLLDHTKVVGHDTRTIATNHTVKVMRVSSKVTAAKISLAG
ncbi:hypothetical protein [Solirubrobacter soli]|uniref:hypothetical protein n=1 Tax=Solirubrobacter soli TaxID=363832 RepID=UPI0004009A70|nr:hypothetical protein [Solirubrobacter soli]